MKIIWNEVTWYSKTLALIVFVVVLVLGFYLGAENQKIKNSVVYETPTNIVDNDIQNETISMCYFFEEKVFGDLYDKAWLRMDISGDQVKGEYQNLPAQKDSKIGTFMGVVGKLNQNSMSRTAEVWWDSFAEGMNVKEEFLLEFGDGSAVALFGEMLDRGDGVYVYKDKNKLSPGFLLSQIDCSSLEERLSVEKYIKENIKEIATDEPVLGGSWYVVSVNVNYSLNEGYTTYEDGHIQSTASFKYNFDEKNKKVDIVEFKIN